MEEKNKSRLKKWFQDGLGGSNWRGVSSDKNYTVDKVWAFVMIFVVILIITLHLLGIKTLL